MSTQDTFQIYIHDDHSTEAEEYARDYAKGTKIPAEAIQKFLELRPDYEVSLTVEYDADNNQMVVVGCDIIGQAFDLDD